MIHAEPKHLEIIKKILSKYPYDFYAFGSRVKNTAHKFSDLDVLFKEKIPWNIVSYIREDFEESNLPFKVDLISWELCDEGFRKLIEKDLERI